MKLFWLTVLFFLLCFSAQAYEVIAYHEDFESGAPGWQMLDASISSNNWHIFNYAGTQGDVWWMGDPTLASGANIGGYHNHQYLVLDTPARTLTAANATLTFKMRLGLEDPSPSGGYDGWDSFNIRISTDGGGTWNVISGSPAYHFQNSYAFGSEHGEGIGIPGWGGMLTNWTTASFNLNAYVGQSVKIRFAFASDPAYATVDQVNMFGVMLDDISFGGYSNNGVNDGQMSWSSLVPIGGQLWHIATQTAAPSPTHVMKNQNAAGSYNPNMLNYLISPSITLPSSGIIKADFMIMGSFSDTGTFPNVDYWGWEISPDNGSTWNAMSNPYANPDGSNYVYSDAPSPWSSMLASFSLDGMLTNLAGHTVKFRWYFKSNETVNGTGIMIDDFKIINDIIVAPPTNLAATVSGNSVLLSWNAPGTRTDDSEESDADAKTLLTSPAIEYSSNSVLLRNLTAYVVFRDSQLIAQLLPNSLQFNDSNVSEGLHVYYVVAIYDTAESAPSNLVSVFVTGSDYLESAFDDGSAEIGLVISPTQQFAVYHDTYANQSVTLKYAQMYFHTVAISGVIIRVYERNEQTGLPGSLILQVQHPSTSIVQGWNLIPIPNDPVIDDGRFFLGVMVTVNSNTVGVDTRLLRT